MNETIDFRSERRALVDIVSNKINFNLGQGKFVMGGKYNCLDTVSMDQGGEFIYAGNGRWIPVADMNIKSYVNGNHIAYQVLFPFPYFAGVMVYRTRMGLYSQEMVLVAVGLELSGIEYGQEEVSINIVGSFNQLDLSTINKFLYFMGVKKLNVSNATMEVIVSGCG